MEDKTAAYNKERLEDLKRKLRITLANLFQIDSPDLDFGVYRIMNQKRDEITQFMNVDLIEAVDEEFGKYDQETRAEVVRERELLERTIREELDEDALTPTGVKPDFLNTKRARDLDEQWKALKQREKDASMSDVQKAEIFAHIEEFFSRYYKDGDFLSLRRYAANEKYAVPYNGEEVLLHWANKDQYYIKTDRFLKGHGFDVGDYRVMFEVAKAESPDGNGGSGNGDKRYFTLAGNEDEVEYDDEKKLLTIRFVHAPLSDDEVKAQFPPGATRQKPNTDDIVNGTVAAVLANGCIPPGLKKKLEEKERESDANPLLRKHVLGFTKESTSDFFIHKDLGNFLKQELDFYIKNEVFRLDDLGTENEVPVERYVKRAKVLKTIAQRIIDFLAELEDFQKMLWEKKKFVLQSDYCMTIDHVPERYYAEICANKRQVDEWKNLYAIGEDAQQTLGADGIDVAFLRSHPYLVLDTAFFDTSFKDRVLENLQNPDGTPVTDLDEATGGLMIKSENWQALNLLQERYEKQVKSVYIDPPYNTDATKILYLNGYRHSTWLTLMQNVLMSTQSLLDQEGMFFSAIDDFEFNPYSILVNSIFGSENNQGPLIIEINASGRSNDQFFATSHEYYLCYSQNPEDISIKFRELSEEQKSDYSLIDDIGPYKWRDFLRTGGYSTPEERPNSYYPIYLHDNGDISIYPNSDTDEIIWPMDSTGQKRVWRKTKPSLLEHIQNCDIKIDKGRENILKVYIKDRIKEGTKPKSIWTGSKYDASSHGTKLLKKYFSNQKVFDFPKSLYAVEDVINLIDYSTHDIILDYFSGSGTTAHAVLNINDKFKKNLKYVLVDVGNQIFNVAKPRIEKVAYSSNWKDGKPKDTDGQSHIFKYMVLESYEDTLDNIEFLDKSGHVQQTLFSMRDYMLRYFLDFETKESPCRLNIEKMATPFAYTLKVRRDSEFTDVPADKDGFRDVTVDLVETFNYLLGLRVIRRVTREHDGLKYRVVHGTTPDNRKVTVVWRNSPKNPEEQREALEADATFIDEKLRAEFPDTATLYVNGHCFVPGAVPIEPEFKKLMGA